MVSDGPTTRCPNCSASAPEGAAECPSCGVIFAKLAALAARRAAAAAQPPAAPEPAPLDGEERVDAALKAAAGLRSKLRAGAIVLVVLWLASLSVYYLLALRGAHARERPFDARDLSETTVRDPATGAAQPVSVHIAPARGSEAPPSPPPTPAQAEDDDPFEKE